MKNKILPILTVALFASSMHLNAQGYECHLDSNSTGLIETSKSELYDYNGIRTANYSGMDDFSGGYLYTSGFEGNINFSTTLNATNLAFHTTYFQNNNNFLPHDNFINVQIGTTAIIATTSDSLNYYLSPLGYTVSLTSNPGSALGTQQESIYIDGPVFSSFSIGLGIESSITDICVGEATLSTEVNKLNAVNIYPNPSTGLVSIEGIAVNEKISIIDITGKIQFTSLNLNNKIDLSHLPSGIYFLKTLQVTKKIVIE